MEKAMVLTVEQATEYSRKVIWLEMRESVDVLPVTYHSERRPFLRYDCESRPTMVEVRGEYYGKTWRCWDRDPAGRQHVKEWDDEETVSEVPAATAAEEKTEKAPEKKPEKKPAATVARKKAATGKAAAKPKSRKAGGTK